MLLRGGTVLTMDKDDRVVDADILIEDGHIARVQGGIERAEGCYVELVDIAGCYVLPGFVQTHVHLCQSLWRNLADDISLMEWLRKFTWPLEAAHTPETIRAATRLGAAELLLSGTTTIADMGTVRHTEVLVETATKMGLRGVFSKVLMDEGDERLAEHADEGLSEALELAKRYNKTEDPVRFALAPRFAVSCSLRLLEEVAAKSNDLNLFVHTHCAENDEEVHLTLERFGFRPAQLLASLGLLGPRSLLAHCVKVTPREIECLAASGSHVLHCPTANLKLGSGIAPIYEMLAAGVHITIGADGAPCNNNLSALREVRLASLLQKGLHGPKAMPARQVLRMATIEGAKALGLDCFLGSVEPGKLADLVVIDPGHVSSVPNSDPAAAIVYSTDERHIRHVLVGGEFVVRDGQPVSFDAKEIVEEAQAQARVLLARAGLNVPRLGPFPDHSAR